MDDKLEPENDCRKPCDHDVNCPHCADYWARMQREGLWDKDRHRWTEKGWNDIVRHV